MNYLRWAVLGVVSYSLTGFAAADVTPKSSAQPSGAWLGEFQRYAEQEKLSTEFSYPRHQQGGSPTALIDVLRLLPEPQAWPDLRQAFESANAQVPAGETLRRQRLQAGYWLLTYLTGDRAALETALTAAVAEAAKTRDHQQLYGLRRMLTSLTLTEASALSPEQQIEAFERELAKFETEPKAEVSNPMLHYLGLIARHAFSEATDLHYTETLHVPDLVALAGRDRAEVLIRRALQVPAKLEIDKQLSQPTRDLVRALAVATIDTVKVPSWALIDDENATALFEAFAKKFPVGKRDDYDYREAGSYYVGGLIKAGRATEAVTFIETVEARAKGESNFYLRYEMTERLEQTHAPELWEFYRTQLAANPATDEWRAFTRLSVQLNRHEELMAMIKAQANNPALRGMERLRVQQLQANAELATDDLPAAVARLRTLVQRPAETDPERELQLKIAEQLLQLADVQGDVDGAASALSTVERLVANGTNDDPTQSVEAIGRLTATLNELGRWADSARLGRMALDQVTELEKAAQSVVAPKNPKVTSSEAQRHLESLTNYSLAGILAQQLCAEVELGHWTEAAALLQENPWWGVTDVSALIGQDRLTRQGRPVGYYMARVAQSQGDLVLTRRILEAQLVATPGSDALYEFYLKLVGQEALPLLEKLAAADRYEERPLIWKARLQLDAQHVDAAIATLQQAITIDPSDGEQGRGDRMRVYAFMSDAMTAKGDTEKAAFFANVVKAIRLSETADRWLDVEAVTHALTLYRQSLGFFQDAYCIQSRLAVRLARDGKMDEAAEHYRRAFELMPDSFGRVESHCFGCEHVFAGEKSQSVAEDVFARLLKARPDKAQLYYLSGYLREEQKREAEAAEYYRQAVTLDPLYLNAWHRLAKLEKELKFTPAQRDDLLLKLVELDPAQRHVSADLEKVRDLPRLWRVLKEAGHVLDQLPQAGALWELKASTVQLAKTKDRTSPRRFDGEKRKDFATILWDHRFVEALQSYLAELNPNQPE